MKAHPLSLNCAVERLTSGRLQFAKPSCDAEADSLKCASGGSFELC